MARAGTLSAALVVAVSASAHTRADVPTRRAPESVAVAIVDCEPAVLPGAAVRDAIGLELRGGGVRHVVFEPESPSAVEAPASVQSVLEVDCGSRASLRLAARDRDAQAAAERDVPLDDVPAPDWPRVIALTLAELLEALGYALDSAAPPPPEPSPATTAPEPAATAPPAEPPAAAPPTSAPSPPSAPHPPPEKPREQRATEARSPSGIDGFVLGRGRILPAHGSRLFGFGGGLRLGRPSFGVEALFGHSPHALGRVTAGTAAATAGYTLFEVASGPLLLSAGVAASAGLTWVRGEGVPPASGTTELDVYGDVRATASAQTPARGLGLLLALEAGRAAGLIATADGAPVLATGGWFAGAALGAAF